jgi:hypothetical protein
MCHDSSPTQVISKRAGDRQGSESYHNDTRFDFNFDNFLLPGPIGWTVSPDSFIILLAIASQLNGPVDRRAGTYVSGEGKRFIFSVISCGYLLFKNNEK